MFLNLVMSPVIHPLSIYPIQVKFAQTRVRGKEEFCISPSPKETINITQLLRQRSISSSGSHSDEPSSPTSNDDPMSVDSPVGRVRLRFVSESDSVSMNEVSS